MFSKNKLVLFLLFFLIFSVLFYRWNAISSIDKIKNEYLTSYNYVKEDFSKEKFQTYLFFQSKLVFKINRNRFVIDDSDIIDRIIRDNYYLNKEIDLHHNYSAKYFLNVNPEDKFVNEAIKGLELEELEEDEIKWRIFNFVKEEIKYAKDKNWETDYVLPSSVTLYRKKGDCDDLSVLLASMFMAAGIKEVQLCFSIEEDFSHVFVATRNVAWDASSDDIGSVSDEIREWKYNCYEINEFLEKIK